MDNTRPPARIATAPPTEVGGYINKVHLRALTAHFGHETTQAVFGCVAANSFARTFMLGFYNRFLSNKIGQDAIAEAEA